VILRLDVPPLRAGIKGLRIVRWCGDVGTEVAFGTIVVELAPTEQIRDARRRGTFVEQVARPTDLDTDDDAAAHVARMHQGAQRLFLIASDRGYLRQIFAGPDTDVPPEATLALLTVSPDEPLSAEPNDALPFRAVADFADHHFDDEEP
jgi:hypothetical protein